jgi:hypothetical protein
MEFTLPQLVFFGLTFVCVLFWSTVRMQQSISTYQYDFPFAVFSLFQWVIICAGGIKIFGFLLGLAYLAFCLIALQYVFSITFVAFFWGARDGRDTLVPTALFVVAVWPLLFSTISLYW